MFQRSSLSIIRVRNLTFSVLSLTVFVSGVNSMPLHAQTMTKSEQMPIAQVTDEAKNAQLQRKTFMLLDTLKAGKYEEAQKMAAPDLAKQLTPETIAKLWENVIKTTGDVQKYGDTSVVNTINGDVVIVETMFSKTTQDLVVTYNQAGEIVGVNVPGLQSVEQISQDLIMALSEKNYTVARQNLHPFLKGELFSEQIQEKWENVIAQNGAFKSIKDVTIINGFGRQNGQLVTVTVEFEKTTDDILIIFDGSRLITGVNMAVE